MRRLIGCAALLCTLAAQAGDPHWTVQRGYALSPHRINERFVVTTPYPRGMLLYDVDWQAPHPDLGPDYAAATTQDGVRVYLLKSDISRNTFADLDNAPELVFNADHRLCRQLACNFADDTTTRDVQPGDTFNIEPTPDLAPHRMHKLVTRRGGSEIVGFIGRDELADLVSKGIVTRADVEHPRYEITKKKGSLPNTACGQGIDKERDTSELSPTDEQIISTLRLGQIAEQDDEAAVRFNKDYGGPEEAYRFFLYDILSRADQQQSRIIATVVYACERQLFAPALERLLYIKQVFLTLVDDGGRQVKLQGHNTPRNLIEHTVAPYLWSINAFGNYWTLMEHLSGKLQDRSLAGYFLSEFNRSCNSTARSQPPCRGYHYADAL